MKHYKQYLYVALPIILMIVIFIFSSEGTASSARSLPLADFLRVPEWLVRKAAHILAFATLGALWYNVFKNHSRITPAFRGFLPLALAIAYAIIDEFHQSLIPGRSGLVSDVLLDALSALAGIIIFATIFYLTLSPAQKRTRRQNTKKVWQNNAKLLKKLKNR